MIFHTLPISILPFILIFTRLSTSLANETELYANCRNPFQCANIQNISYPFWGGDRLRSCGHPSFELNCETEGYPQITIQSSKYRVLSIDSTKSSITVVRSEFWDSFCPSTPSNATLDTPYLTFSSISENITLYYGCLLQNPLFPNHFDCQPGEGNTTSYYRTQYHGSNIFNLIFESCYTNVLVQVNHTSAKALSSNPPSIDISIALRSGFELVWDVNNDECSRCVQSDGVCGSNPNSESSSFSCFCSDRAYEVSCNNSGSGIDDTGRKSHSKLIKIGLFVAGAVAGCLALGFAIFICRKRRKRNVVKSAEFRETKTKDIPFAHLSKSLTATSSSTSFSRSTHSFPSSKYDSGKPSSYYGVKVFHYTELEEATDNFNPSRELGDGGFGMVFYGKLDDGREVAVKRFYENNFRRVGQFMNEVDILKELSHTNLVRLYGYTSRRSRELLLVYEYIPNGTVADHLHGKRAKSGLLSWPIRLSIAIETAEALAYLHKSKIIHRDVKTTNILLDNNFRVKVADFGLSRLFPNDVTHVSTIPQGTPGYVDPEYHRCYHLTEKSDVYSFGVVLVELISSKQAVDITRDRHDINLSNMAVNKIQNGKIHELVDPSLGFETNSSVKRMITLVAEIAFQCLQDERDMRPSMEELLEVLKRIKNNENVNATKVMDIVIGDEAALLKNSALQISPNSVTVEKWISNATMPNNNILSTF